MAATQYNVGIHLSAINNVTPVLNRIASQLRGLQNHTINLTGRFHGLRAAIHGAGGAAAAWTGLHAIEKTLEVAKELSHEMVQIQKLGITDQQFAQVKDAAQRVPGLVPGSTEKDAYKAYGSMYSMFGHEGAISMMESVSRFAAVLGNTTHDYKGAADKVYAMIRAGDLMGKFVDETTHKVDINKLNDFLGLASKMTLVTHGKVDPATWFALAQQGGPALSGMSDQGLMTMGIVSQAMGGSRAGTALSSLYSQIIGGITTQRTAAAMKDIGLISDFHVLKGGHVKIDDDQKNPEFLKAVKGDLVDFVKLLKDGWEKQGKNQDQMLNSLYTLFGRQTTQRLIHDVWRNLPQIEGERDRAAGAMGIGASADLANKKDLSQVMNNFEKSWERLLGALGNSQGAIDLLNRLTGALSSMTDWANEHPTAVKLFGEAVMGAVAALGVLAGAAMITALGAFVAGGPIAVGVAAVVGAVALIADLNLEGFHKALVDIVDSIKSFISSLIGAAQGAAAAVSGAVKGIGDAWKAGPGAVHAPAPNGGTGGSFNGAPSLELAPKPFTPGRQGALPMNNHVALHIDGHKIAHAMTASLASYHEHPTSAPHFDGSRGFMPADGQFATV